MNDFDDNTGPETPGSPYPSRSLFRGGVLSALGHRDYRLVWSGALLSNIGTWVFTAALLWYVKVLTGSNSWVGAVNMANFIPVLFLTLFAGSLADHYDRRKLILWGQVAMMVGSLGLGICATLGIADLPEIMISVLVMGVAFALTFPAWWAMMPDLVPAEDLMNAVALSSAQYNLGRFLGPAIAALVLSAWSVDVAFYINAASFLFVIVALLAMRTETPSYPPSEGTLSHIGEGLKYVRGHRMMVSILVLGGIAGFFGFSFMVLAPGFARDVLHQGKTAYGVILLSYGLGAMAGAPLVTYLRRKVSEPLIIEWSLMLVSVTMIGIALSRLFWLTCVLSVFSGLGFLVFSTACNAALQSRSRREMRGRVISLYIMVFIGVFPIGGQLVGWFSDITSAPWALGIAGLACMMTGLAMILFPSLLRDAHAGEERHRPEG